MNLLEENAAILQRFLAEGSDLSAKRGVDFEHLFAQRRAADAFSNAAEVLGFTPKLYERDDGHWDVCITLEIIPTAEAITETEERLGRLAREHDGKADGWGFFRT